MPPVKLYEITEEINEHNQLPLNPHPPYGLITGYHCYPYLFYGSKQYQVTPRKVKILVAENEYLKIGMASAYGGRLWFMYDKVKRRDIIHRIHTDAKIFNAGMGYNYMGGGLELNLPNAHSYTNLRYRFCTATKNTDGSASLIMSNTEKVGRIHWTVSFSLFPGKARVVQKVRIANESPFEERYLYWANCGIPVGANTEFIYPEAGGAMHGRFENIISWPTFMKRNLGVLKNVDGMFGLYMLGAREGYFGYYDHDAKSGLIHYADVNDLPGKKYWSWGWHESGQHTALTHNDRGQCYGEIQSGRVVIQEEFDRILPMTNASWVEYWYPYREIGVINGASALAGVNFGITAEGKKLKAAITVFANRPFTDANIVIRQNERVVFSCSGVKLPAAAPFTIEKEITAAKPEKNELALEVTDKKGDLIVAVRALKDKPQETDTYFIPDKLPEKTSRDFTAEGYFFRAEKLAREWMFHLPAVKNMLEEALKSDPDYSKAHAELGLMHLRAGQYQEAIVHFDKALERIYDDGRTLYYKGLAHRLSGNIPEALYDLRQAGRFGYESQERIAEAQLFIQHRNYEEALKHLDRAVALNGTVVLGHILKALVLHRLKKGLEAAQCYQAAERESPFSPLVLIGKYLLANCPAALKKQIQERYRLTPEEILEVVATLYFAGLADEALDALSTLQVNNAMVALYRRRLQKETGRKMKLALKPDLQIAPDFAWKIEDFMMLARDLAENPQDARTHYHLGNFYYGHGLENEGLQSWEKARKLGYRDKILLYAMARAYRRKNEMGKYRRLLKEAYATDKNDPYIYDDYVALLRNQKGAAGASAFVEKNIGHAKKYFSTAAALMRDYLTLGQYAKLEKFMAGVNFAECWRTPFCYYYVILRLARGFQHLCAGEYEKARAAFQRALPVPSNLGKNFFCPYAERARRLFYLGLCDRQLKSEETARRHWQEALSFDQQATFELAYDFQIMRARYYQAFCLRALGRFPEADVYIHGLRKFAQNPGLSRNARQELLRWAYLGREKDIAKFDRFDTVLGITAFATTPTTVED